MSNNPNVNKNLLEENRALQEKLRMVERECDNDKRNIDKLRSENDRMSDKAKKDLEREIERREREIKDNVDRVKRENEREVAKIKGDFERIKREKDRLDVEMAEAKKKHIEEVNSLREGKNRSSLELKSLANEEISNLKKRIETLEL